MDDPEKIISLYDPGETDRAEQNGADRVVVTISNWLAWIFPALMAIIVTQVFLRNFGRLDIGPGNQAWMDDLQWWLYGIACLVGIAYAVTTNSHVRVDIFYDNFSKTRQSRVDLFALGWLFLPFAMLVWDVTFHYAYASVLSGEGSDSPNGLHNLWALKVLTNLCFALLALAIFARVKRILRRQGLTSAWETFKWTLPSIAFGLNLTIFYLAWWATKLTQADMKTRQIASKGYLMAEIEYGPYETKLTVILALVATALLGAVFYALRAR